MQRFPWESFVIGAGVLALPSGAFAQEAGDEEDEEKEPPANKTALPVATPSAPVQRTDFLHEGFYWRFSAGPGFLMTTGENTETGDEFSATDFALGSELLIGGSPAPGVTFGGGLQGSMAVSTHPALAYLGGPFFDAFPNRKEGFHLGTMIGIAGAAPNNGLTDAAIFGGGLSAWGGYDIWVAPEWSVGLNLRGTGAQLGGADASVTTFSMHFLISLLNH